MSCNHSHRRGLLVIFAFISINLLADIPDTIQLDQVEIKSKAISIEVLESNRSIDTAAIQSLTAGSLADLVRLHSSIYVKSNGPGSLSTVSFRGTAASQTLVLWNGFPINGLQLGQVDFSTVPVYFSDQVNLSWGAAANERSGGIGGVVMLDNKAIFGAGIAVNVMQAVGSFKTFGTFGSVAYSNKHLYLKTRFFRKSSENDFTYLNAASWPKQWMKQENADYVDKGFLQEVHLNYGNNIFSFTTWNQWNNRNLPPIMTNLERGGNPKEYSDERFHRNVIAYKKFWNTGKLELKTGYFIDNQHYYLQTTSNSEPYQVVSLIDSKNEADSWMNSFNISQNLRKWLNLNGQMLFDIESVESNNFDGIKNRKRASAAIGAEFMPIEQIKANINIRNDRVDGLSKGISPSIELMYQPAFLPNFGFSFGYSKNLRYPSMNDLFWYPGGNELLKPEQSLTAETAINWAPKVDFGVLSLNVCGFYSNIDDWILWQPTNFRYWSPENIANVLARGIEVHQNLNFVYQKWRYQSTVNYAFTVTTDESQTAQNKNTDGKQLMYIPRHHANGFVKAIYNMYYTTYNVDYTGVRNINFDADSYNFSQLPAYWLHHFSIGVQTKSWDIALKINNIFNKSYQAVLWRPMPGRNFELLVQYQIVKK